MLAVRSLEGKLTLKSLDTQIVIGDIFAPCKTIEEVEWIAEQLTAIVECQADERKDEIWSEEELCD